MTGSLILMRIVRPDGSVAAQGPLVADLTVIVCRQERTSWPALYALGWRTEPVP